MNGWWIAGAVTAGVVVTAVVVGAVWWHELDEALRKWGQS